MSDSHTRDKNIRRGVSFMLMAVFALCLLLPVKGEAKVRAPKMQCHAYAVMDAGSGEILFGQDENKMIYPASTAKLMTAIVCVENGNVNKKIKTRSEIVNGTTYGTYCLGLPSGVKFTFNDLLSMCLVASAADATDSLAAGVFGSKEACVEAMNAKCAEMGLTQTSFDNPVGSDIGAGFYETYSTAAEMAEICRYAMTIPIIRTAVAKSHYDSSNGLVSCNTTNWFLRGLSSYDEDEYTVIGSKSGTTNAAGDVFIATAVDDEGHEVICAYFGNVSKESTFSSIRKLFDYTFKKYKNGKLQLTSGNYDVRCSEDLGDVYNEYAALNCFPSGKDGLYHPQKAVTRTELAKMFRGVDNLSGNAVLDVFEKGNSKGTVTVSRLASLIQELYPEHLTEEEVEETLSGCTNAEELTEEEKEAYALFLQNGLSSDDSCRNAKQILTRKQALLIADRLSDYQVRYYASHPEFLTGDAQPAEAEGAAAGNVSTEGAAGETSAADNAAAGTSEGTGTQGVYPALSCGNMDALAGFNKKWMEYLTDQIIRTAEEGA